MKIFITLFSFEISDIFSAEGKDQLTANLRSKIVSKEYLLSLSRAKCEIAVLLFQIEYQQWMI